jgi:hypothetical protein
MLKIKTKNKFLYMETIVIFELLKQGEEYEIL